MKQAYKNRLVTIHNRVYSLIQDLQNEKKLEPNAISELENVDDIIIAVASGEADND